MKPLRLPWRGRMVPSALLDVIRGCNCTCRACFNNRPPQVKPLSEIAYELSVIRSRRDVACIGISGGEPLLHPDILGIVGMVKEKGVDPTLLTNGALWSDEFASKAAEAGLGLVLFHVQQGQVRPDSAGPLSSAEAARLLRQKCASAARHGIEAAGIATVNVRRPDEVVDILKTFRENPDCSLCWMTLEREMRAIGTGRERMAEGNGVAEMSDLLAPLGWRPFGGIGGRHRPDVWRWMAYHGYARVDAAGCETAFTSLSPSVLENVVLACARLFRLKVPARMRPSRGALVCRLVLNALTGGGLRNLGFALGALARSERIVPRHLIVEALPELLPDGRIEHCEPCLDATVVRGELVPPCLADLKTEGGPNE